MTIGFALQSLLSGSCLSITRLGKPWVVRIVIDNESPVLMKITDTEQVPYLASEEEESAFDWLCNN